MKRETKIRIMTILIIVICVIAILVGTIYLLSPENPITVKYTLQTDKVDNEIKFVQISDLHSSKYSSTQGELISLVKKEKPDLIFLTGDIFDESRSEKYTEIFLDGIKNICPIYFCFGNHENYGIKNEVIEILGKYGVNILENNFATEVVKGVKLGIYGIEDMDYKKPHSKWTEKLNLLSEKVDTTCYNVLLAHRPTAVGKFKNTNFDLIVSGHAHGGQWRPFGINGLYTPDEGLFPKYAGGKYNLGSNYMIVSRGLCKNKIPRLLNKPEIVSISIKTKTQK